MLANRQMSSTGAAASLPIAFDAPSSAQQAAGATLTFAHTVGAGAKRILVVHVGWGASIARTVSGVTYNAVALTQLSGAQKTVTNMAGTEGLADIWYLLNPASGTANIVITASGAPSGWMCGGTSWANVNQSTPFGTPSNTSAALSGLNVPVTLTLSGIASNLGEVVVGQIVTGLGPTIMSSNDTERYEIQETGNTGALNNGASKAAAAGTTSMSWAATTEQFKTENWIATAVALKP